MENPLGIAIGLIATLENQIAGSLERDAIEARRHGMVERIVLVLPIDDDRPRSTWTGTTRWIGHC